MVAPAKMNVYFHFFLLIFAVWTSVHRGEFRNGLLPSVNMVVNDYAGMLSTMFLDHSEAF